MCNTCMIIHLMKLPALSDVSGNLLPELPAPCLEYIYSEQQVGDAVGDDAGIDASAPI